MGAWGPHSFENDRALDWLGDYLDSPSDDRLRATFDPPSRGKPPGLIAKLFGGQAKSSAVPPDEEQVLAAAEVIAAMRGHPLADAPDGFARLTLRPPPDDLVSAAIRGVDLILDESSELNSLWRGADDFSTAHRGGLPPEEDSEDYLAWLAGLRDLRERLTRP
ncbi:DUF4259 domain-containing protein [Luteolibacter rhizosphaerae]|uniref:DUF4259 domain-containing protein n=1 Tax=Luteolibacter rhizosphaerae TaxID=2989719 RepID=UPI003CE4EA80